jgi:tetratricopeptide (TPR) repeat protein
MSVSEGYMQMTNEKIHFLKLMIESINEPDCPVSYAVISEALHSLDLVGEDDLERFKVGYIRKTLTENEHDFMEWHLRSCKRCLDDVFFKAKLSSAFHIMEQSAKSLIDQANTHQDQGNVSKAIECYNKALELRPGDEEIKRKLSELLAEGGDPYPIPDDLKRLVDPLSILKSMNLFRGNMGPSQDVLMGERSFGAKRGVQEDIYLLGDRINIDLEPPKDGYLTILLYDDENNLKLLFPEKGTDDTFVKGGEKKQFGIVAAEPLCKQYLKAFWTSDQLMVPDQIDFGDESAIRSAIETFLESISALSDDDWMVFVQQFDVVAE